MEGPEIHARVQKLAIAGSEDVRAYCVECQSVGLHNFIEVGITFGLVTPDQAAIEEQDQNFLKAMRIAAEWLNGHGRAG